MKFWEVLIVLNLCAIASVHGQLNASRLELTQRFGQPKTENRNQTFGSTECIFHRDGWVIRASMLNGRCQMISYLKSQLPWPTNEQISSLLESNSSGSTWSNEGVRLTSATVAGTPFPQVHYPRSDGGAYLVKAVNGVVFKSAHWHQFEEGTQGRGTETPKWLQPHQATSSSLQQRPGPFAPVKLVKSFLFPSRGQARPQPQRLAMGEALKPVGVLPLLGLALILAVPVFRVVMRSPSVKGWIGEKLTFHLILKRLDPAVYQVFNDIYLPRLDGQGSTQIDHVVLSPYGIFVIETKNLKGWIFGKEQDNQWTQQLYRKRVTFQNPLLQNDLHLRTLRASLKLPSEAFHSIVFLIGNCELKSAIPPNVMKAGLGSYIESHHLVVLDDNQVNRAHSDLTALVRTSRKGAQRRDHIRHLQLRRGGNGERKAASG